MKRLNPPSPFTLVLWAIALGLGIGYQFPSYAIQLKPLGDWFITAVRWLVCPMIFVTVSTGIASAGQVRLLGRLGLKTIAYFECASTLALLTGFAVAHVLQPGAGFPLGVMEAAGKLPAVSEGSGTLAATVARAFRDSIILQSLVAACVCGVLLVALGERARRAIELLDRAAAWLLRMLNVLMLLAPVAAFTAIAFTVARFGIGSIAPLLTLLVAIYAAVALFILIPLALIARQAGFRILRLAWYLKEELLLVFGTSSSLAAMPKLIQKLEQAGCPKAVTGMTIPAGYSFNLNASNIYVAVAAVFLAQAMQVEMGPWQYLSLLAVASVTTKGASGVTGSAFIVLAATISAIPAVPESSLLFIVGIERLLKCRPIGNVVGNAAACLVIAAWDKRLDRQSLEMRGLA